MIQNKIFSILFALALVVIPASSTQALNNDGIAYALIKGIIEAAKTGTFHQAEETHKSLNPVVKSSICELEREAINKFNLTEATLEWLLNCTLQKYTGRTLCSGKNAGKIDFHKLIRVACMEAARLAVTPASATNDKILRLYLVNILRALSIRGFALEGVLPKTKEYSALALNSLNENFWADLVDGSVDWEEMKDLGGHKYRDIQSGVGFVAVNNMLDYSESIAKHNNRVEQDHHLKFISDLTYILAIPFLKYAIAYTAKMKVQTPGAVLNNLEKVATPVANKICAGTMAAAQTITPMINTTTNSIAKLYASIAQATYNATHSKPKIATQKDDQENDEEETETTATEKQNSVAA